MLAFASSAPFCANAALAQTAGMPFLLVQEDAASRADIVQPGDLSTAEIVQTGGDNRAFLAQPGSDTLATIDQAGRYNRALVLQGDGPNDLQAFQEGRFNTLIVLQSGTANGAGLSQTGERNELFLQQDASLVLPTSEDDLALLGRNFLFATDTLMALPEMAERDGLDFADTIRAHLAEAPGACEGPGRVCGLWSDVAVLGGRQDDRPGAFGYDYDALSATVGLDAAFGDGLLGGVALRYSHLDGDVGGFSDLDADTLGGAVYGRFQRGGFFVSAGAFASRVSFEMSREGFDAPVRAEPDGTVTGATVEAGYLADLGALSLGPVTGFTAVHSDVDNYSERGDAFLTQDVPGLSAKARIATLGARLLYRGAAFGTAVTARSDIAYERDFSGGSERLLLTEFSFAPGAEIATPVAEREDENALRVAAGLDWTLPANVTLGLDAKARIGETRESYGLGARLSKDF